MSRERDRSHPTDAFGLPEGLLAAIVCALLLVGTFAVVSSYTAMPPSEYWAALTTFALLALGATLPGCAALYDALGSAVRRDWRAAVALLALVPALYVAYAGAVRELNLAGLVSACSFALVPALAFGAARGSRQPTLFDGVGMAYLAVSLWLGLLPGLALPQQGGQVGFFQLASVPLLLLLFAWRGWPGLGFTWHLGGHELRDALLAGLAGAVLVALVTLATGGLRIAPNDAGGLLSAAVAAYFFTALPAELLLRGGIQNGLARALAGTAGATAPWIALFFAVLVWAGLGMLRGGVAGLVAGAVTATAAGWVYLRTGKVTASAVAHFLIVWIVTILAGGA